jgi:hypothetical protein
VESDDSVFVIGPGDVATLGIAKDPGASSSAPEVRKRTANGGAAQEEEPKQARVGQRSVVEDADWLKERAQSVARLSMAGPTRGQEEAVSGSLTEGVGHGAPQTSYGTGRSVPTVADAHGPNVRPPRGIRGFRLPLLGRVSG